MGRCSGSAYFDRNFVEGSARLYEKSQLRMERRAGKDEFLTKQRSSTWLLSSRATRAVDLHAYFATRASLNFSFKLLM